MYTTIIYIEREMMMMMVNCWKELKRINCKVNNKTNQNKQQKTTNETLREKNYSKN